MRIRLPNGKMVELFDGATVGDLRKQEKKISRDDDVLVDRGGGKTARVRDDEILRDGSKVYVIPKIVKGDRLSEELDLLKREVGGRSEVLAGKKTIGGHKYSAVIVKSVALSMKKFGVTKSDLMLLLPPNYPERPPIGCYLHFPWNTSDQHFTRSGHHGAPDLRDHGWYWYCAFIDESRAVWRPAPSATDGHNLASCFVWARHNVNSDEE
jgi:hypothetical protein